MKENAAPPSEQTILMLFGRLAAAIARGKPPSDKELFLLSAGIVGAGLNRDGAALVTAIECVQVLRDECLAGHDWSEPRARLTMLADIAWIMRRQISAGADSAVPSIRKSPLIGA